MPSNLPPGVTESQIDGDAAWEKVHEGIDQDAQAEKMSDMDVMVAWNLGLKVWKTAKKFGAKFPHE